MNYITNAIKTSGSKIDFRYVIIHLLQNINRKGLDYDSLKLALGLNGSSPSLTIVKKEREDFFTNLSVVIPYSLFEYFQSNKFDQSIQTYHDYFFQHFVEEINTLKNLSEDEFFLFWKTSKNSVTKSLIDEFLDKVGVLVSTMLNHELKEAQKGYPNSPMRTISDAIKQKNATVSKSNNTGCYIATFTYGDINAIQVSKLRRFRDSTLLKNSVGIFFVKIYYIISPQMVKIMSKIPSSRRVSKFILDKIVDRLQ